MTIPENCIAMHARPGALWHTFLVPDAFECAHVARVDQGRVAVQCDPTGYALVDHRGVVLGAWVYDSPVEAAIAYTEAIMQMAALAVSDAWSEALT